MKLSLAELWEIRGTLELHLNGINIRDGSRIAPKNTLPVSMKQHLRRVLDAVTDEIKIAEPDREAHMKKWKVYGEKKDSLPTPEDECFAEYEKEAAELFEPRDFVIPFSPFKLELFDNINIVLDDGIDNFMIAMNQTFNAQQEQVAAEETPSAGEDKFGAEPPKPDVK